MRHLVDVKLGDRIEKRLHQDDAVVPTDLLSRAFKEVGKSYPSFRQAAEIEMLRQNLRPCVSKDL